MYKLRSTKEKGKDLKDVVVDSLLTLMDENPSIIALDADLGAASGFLRIQKNKPKNFLQCGIAEANMVGVAAGLSVVGMTPFLHTFGPFASRRVFDQIFLSGGYAHTTMNIFGSDPGFTVGPNGGTHTTWEDVALLRMIPNSIICDPADATQLEWIIKEFAGMTGIHYVRANRKPVRDIYEADSTFTMGKGNVIKQGSDVLLIAAGQLVVDALDCAESLETQGVSVEVVDMFCIKPLDKDLVLQEAQGKKAIVTFENHSITGGLGSAVAEVVAEAGLGIKVKRVGVNERFGQVGTPEYLQNEFKLTAKDLEEAIKEVI